MPDWVTTLEQAREWGIPPWQVEQELTMLWHLRYVAYQNEIATAKRTKSKHGR